MSVFCTDIACQTIRVNGVCYSRQELEWLRQKEDASEVEMAIGRELLEFLTEWFAPDDRVCVHTSGSTGKPKEMWVEKKRMMASACLTCSFLGLQAGDSALLCMPLKYIAGKMVVVRALVAGLDLCPVSPSGHPLAGVMDAPVFAAMVPLQVYNSLQVDEERRKLQQIRSLIIGGGAIDDRLGESLKQLPYEVWSTYGMTETLSHIAMRRLNGEGASEWYTPLEGVSISLSEERTLAIEAPRVSEGKLVTNDIAEINAYGRFRILGRKDNTINSGGVKIQAEQVEDTLRPYIASPFLITSVPDEKLGERVVLLVEAPLSTDVTEICERILPTYWRPKSLYIVERIPFTETGKPDRALAKVVAKKFC